MRARAAILLSVAALGAHAAPYRPASGSEVVETLPQRADPAQRELRALREQLTRNPRDLALATALAQRYIGVGRSQADPRYYGYAQAALAPWWGTVAAPPRVRVLRATLRQATHRFDEALVDLDAVTLTDPGNGQAWLTRATVLAVQGRFAEAAASCARVRQLAEPLVGITCSAQVASLNGRLPAAEAVLSSALAQSGAVAPELQAWTSTLLGEMAVRRGESALAEKHYLAALKASPQDSYLLGAYADLLLDLGRYDDVRRLLEPYQRIDPLLLRYALALQGARSDPAQLAQAVQALDARFAAAALRQDSVHMREQSRYLLHLRAQPAEALRVALRDWQVQKEPADVRVVLEAALAAGQPKAAAPVLDWLGANGLEDHELAPLLRQFGGRAS